MPSMPFEQTGVIVIVYVPDGRDGRSNSRLPVSPAEPPSIDQLNDAQSPMTVFMVTCMMPPIRSKEISSNVSDGISVKHSGAVVEKAMVLPTPETPLGQTGMMVIECDPPE